MTRPKLLPALLLPAMLLPAMLLAVASCGGSEPPGPPAPNARKNLLQV